MLGSFFGLDIFRLFLPPWVTANVLFGLALRGHNVNAAVTFPATLSEFENEKGR